MCAFTAAPQDKNCPLPDPAYLAVLEKRFQLAGLEHPLYQCLFNQAVKRLPPEGTNPPPLRGLAVDNSQEPPLITLDPVNLVQMEVKLPPLPTVLAELQALTSNRNSSASDVATVIARDPALTAWILKLVNSPFFGFSVKVDTVTRAVTLVGMQQIHALAIGGMLNTLMVRIPQNILDIDTFWRHSIATGIAAQLIWKTINRPESERLFVAGLLHDCGMLALAYAAPKTFTTVECRLRVANQPRHVMEQSLLGFDHPRLGGMLLHRWNMPLPLVMAILHHHEVETPQRHPEAAVVHIADLIAFAILGADTHDAMPPISNAAWDFLGLGLGQVEQIFQETSQKFGALSSAFTEGSKAQKPRR